jgi:chemotaxis protein methyltransferase CheR
MTPADYEYLRKLLKERSGLMLSADKQYLVESRLLPVAHRAGFDSLAELVGKLRGLKNEPLITKVAEAMTTNESFFFRDKLPFEHFNQTIMPALLAARAPHRRIRIWCAAASTGQEPYSLAMSLKEMGDKIAGRDIEILATEFSTEVLEKAKSGVFTQFEVQRGLPIQLLIKYFDQVGDHWQINPDVRAMVQFRPFNLLHEFTHLGRFDLVFCRNVLIYFDQETKIRVLDRIERIMEHDGYLALGAAETVVGLTDSFKPLPEHRGVYVPNLACKGRATSAISPGLRLAAAAATR